MCTIDTDYLVIGAGASGMAFVDSLLSLSDARIVLVDRRHAAGGHWLHAYPFVRLHQPSATYGVNSRPLGEDRIQTSGPDAGFYERASAAQIVDYYANVLADFVATGRVEFVPNTSYVGEDSDGHHLVSLLSGADTVVRARTFVDATYVESTIPSRHTPSFVVADGVRLVTPNALVDLAEPCEGFTVLGAGKTAMDSINWLLDGGVDPDRIRWVKPSEALLIDRAGTQPLDLVAGSMRMQADWVESCAEAATGAEFAAMMLERGSMWRVDERRDPDVWRGATVNRHELEGLRSVENVVRAGKLRRLDADAMTFEHDLVASGRNDVYVDCTAAGLRVNTPRPIFEPNHINVQFVTIGNACWSAAILGAIEASGREEAEKNRLAPVVAFSGQIADILRLAHAGMSGLAARSMDPELAAWAATCRLDGTLAARAKGDDPDVAAEMQRMSTHLGAAFANLAVRA